MKIKKFILIYFILIGLVTSITFFWIGFHDVDNSYNVLKISYDNDLDTYYNQCDKTAYGNCIDFVSLYVLGMNLMRIANGALMFLCVMCILLYLNENRYLKSNGDEQ